MLKHIKGAIDSRQSVNHSAAILANAFMHSGTSIDTFLRENLEWLSRATNWAKFSATAGLGVIHRGQLAQGGCWVLLGAAWSVFAVFLCLIVVWMVAVPMVPGPSTHFVTQVC